MTLITIVHKNIICCKLFLESSIKYILPGGFWPEAGRQMGTTGPATSNNDFLNLSVILIICKI
jgi:hypothetical protein